MARMLLQEKLDKGLIKVGDYIGFQPDYAECALMPTETGWEEEQILHTEVNMKWQLVCFDGQLALLADAVTKQEIYLRGKIGYDKGVEALEKYARECWSSKKIRAKGICTTKEQCKKLPIILRYVEGIYWLGTQCTFKLWRYTHFDNFVGVWGVRNYDVGYGVLFVSDGHTYSIDAGVRPAVLLPFNIMIDDDNNLVPFDKAEEVMSTETSSVPSGLVSLGTEADRAQAQNCDAKKQLEAMIAEQKKKIAEQSVMLEKMEALLSKL